MKSRVMMQIADRRIVEEEWDVPPVGMREALIKIDVCGMCGSDVEQYRGTFAANKILRYPLIPGHEPIGRIVEIGRKLRDVEGRSRRSGRDRAKSLVRPLSDVSQRPLCQLSLADAPRARPCLWVHPSGCGPRLLGRLQ